MSIVAAPRRAFHTTHVVIENTEGASKVSNLICDVVALRAHIHKSTPGTERLESRLRNFHGLTSGICFFRKIVDWMKKDNNGKWVWQKDPMTVAFSASITSYYGLSFLRHLDRRGIIRLAASFPIVKLIDAATIISCITDIWNSAKTLRDLAKENSKAKQREIQWIKIRSNNESNNYHWQTFTSFKRDLEKVSDSIERKKRWEMLAQLNKDEAEVFCEAKVMQWSRELKNLRNQKINAWASIVFDISILAAIAMSFFVGVFPLLIAGVVVSIIEVSCFALDLTLKTKEVIPAQLPARLVWKKDEPKET